MKKKLLIVILALISSLCFAFALTGSSCNDNIGNNTEQGGNQGSNQGGEDKTEYEHQWSQEWARNDTHHWHECTVDGCTERSDYAEHDFSNGDCVCGYKAQNKELIFQLNSDNITYSVIGIGTNTETNIIIPDLCDGKPVNCIGKEAFIGCSSLTSVTIPDSVTSIGWGAFRGCSSLTSVSLGNGVTSIGSSAFSACSSLTSITIPNSVTSISNSAFIGCSSLTSVTLGNGVTSIGESAFGRCSSLTSVIIPESVISIGDRAFWDCSGLTNITIPDSVTSIGKYSFDDCSSLTSVTLGNGVTSIGQNAFGRCSSLTSVTIPDSVTSIDSSAFSECDSLTIYCEAASKPSGWNWTYSNHPMVWDCKNNDKDGGGNAYSVIDGIRYSLKDGVATVIQQPSNITSANIPEEVTYKNTKYSVTSIDSSAFRGCSSLASSIIGKGVTSIGIEAFYGCTSLTSITVAKGNKVYHSAGNCLIETRSKKIISGCKNSVIPAYGGVTSIGQKAFSGCSSLTSITIPNGVTSIGENAFEDCSSLTSITIPDSVTEIGSKAFNGTALYNDENNWQNGVLYIGKHLIEAKDNIEGGYEIKQNTINFANSAFEYCSSLTSITMSDSVTAIGQNAFRGCSSLTSITIPDNVTYIGDRAFWDCNSLTSVTMPDNVTYIGDRAFVGCSKLTDINFKGTKEQWKAIEKGSNWNNNTGNFTVHCTDGDLSKSES